MKKLSDFQPPMLKRRRFQRIPVRMLVPNVITLLAIAAGLTAIRLGIEARFELALGCIVFAAILDGIDGRVARLIKGQSRFGAELDSLADFVNFGVAPALMLFFWRLHELNNVGWIAALIFAISGGLRLARFNATMDDPDKPAFAANYFTGVPAPAGAICVLLPMYLSLIDIAPIPPSIIAAYTLVIGFLMISRLPVFSGKLIGTRVPREMVVPLVVLVVLLVALLIAYPWYFLASGTVLYLGALPAGWWSYREHERRAAAQKSSAAAPTSAPSSSEDSPPSAKADEDRPRLN